MQNPCGTSKSKACRTDRQTYDIQSNPYVVLCFAGATINCAKGKCVLFSKFGF